VQGLFVPTEAIIQSSHGTYLWVETEKGKFSTKMVKTGIETTGFTEIKTGLVEGEKVVVTGFGTFLVRGRAARKGRNPQTGAEIQIPATKTPGFTAGKSLKRRVK
jgi:DNA-binding protein HU-beta